MADGTKVPFKDTLLKVNQKIQEIEDPELRRKVYETLGENRDKLEGMLGGKVPPEFEDMFTMAPITTMGEKALATITQGLDYPAGITRTAVMGGLTGSLSAADLQAALEGRARGTKEFLGRVLPKRVMEASLSEAIPGAFAEPGSTEAATSMVVPEKGGPLDVTLGGTLGTIGDIALDPGWVFGAKAAKTGLELAQKAPNVAVLRKVLEEAITKPKMPLYKSAMEFALAPGQTALRAAGSKLRKKMFSTADEAAKRKKAIPVSETFYDHGIAPKSYDEALTESRRLIEQLGEETSAIVKEVSRSLERVPLESGKRVGDFFEQKVLLPELASLERKAKLTGDTKEIEAARDFLLKEIQGPLANKEAMTLADLQELKQRYQSLARSGIRGGGGFNPEKWATLSSVAQKNVLELQKGLASRTREQIENIVEMVGKEAGPEAMDLGKELLFRNKQIAGLYEGEEALRQGVKATARRKIQEELAGPTSSAIGAGIFGAALGAGPTSGTASSYAIPAAAGLATYLMGKPRVQQALGAPIQRYAPALGAAARTGLLQQDIEAREKNPWRLFMQEYPWD